MLKRMLRRVFGRATREPRRDYLAMVGWGPFPLPGERKRMDELNAKYDAWFDKIERGEDIR